MDNNINNSKEIQTRNKNHYGIFDPFFDGVFKFPNFKNEIKEMEKLMRTDIRETEKDYIIEIEFPGYNKEDIDIDFANGYLTISSTKSEHNENDSKNNNYIRRERYYGNSVRSFYIGDVKEENIVANLEKGVLNIYVPKQKNQEMKHKIEIK